MRWRLILKEFGCHFNYIKGPKNIVADALSRLPTNYNLELPTKPPNPTAQAENFGFDKLPVFFNPPNNYKTHSASSRFK